MQAAIFHGPKQDLTIEGVDIDKPAAREVLVKTAAAGLCHSDEHLVTGDLGSGDGGSSTSGDESSDWPWFLIGIVGIGLIGGGIYVLRGSPEGLTSTPLIIGFEKGSQPGTAAATG